MSYKTTRKSLAHNTSTPVLPIGKVCADREEVRKHTMPSLALVK